MLGHSSLEMNFLTLSEASQEFGLSRRQVRYLMKVGALHTYRRKLDRRLYLRKSELEKHLNPTKDEFKLVHD